MRRNRRSPTEPGELLSCQPGDLVKDVKHGLQSRNKQRCFGRPTPVGFSANVPKSTELFSKDSNTCEEGRRRRASAGANLV